MEELRRIRSVSAVRGKPYTMRVAWQNGTKATVDMTGVVHRLSAFKPLRDPAAFRKARVIADGLGIGWDGGLDYSARSLRLLAEEQCTLSGADLVEFERRAGLTTREPAQIFDVAPRTASYRRSDCLPRCLLQHAAFLAQRPGGARRLLPSSRPPARQTPQRKGSRVNPRDPALSRQ